MKTKILLHLAAMCGVALAMSAQPRIGISLRIGAPPPVIVREEPPRPPMVEYLAPPPSPGANHVWVRAHHRWMGGRWVSVQGGWVVPPQPGAVWVEGRWEAQNHSWTEEHWEMGSPVNYATPNGPPPSGGPGGNAYSAEPAGEIFVGSAPPPLREERMSPRPSRQHVWIAGYWTGNHGRHEWVAGRWEVPPRERATWVAPRWEQHDRNYVFVRGYWR